MSYEFVVRWVAQRGGQLLDGRAIVVLLVLVGVRRVLGLCSGGAVWRRVSGVGAAAGCGMGCLVAWF